MRLWRAVSEEKTPNVVGGGSHIRAMLEVMEGHWALDFALRSVFLQRLLA